MNELMVFVFLAHLQALEVLLSFLDHGVAGAESLSTAAESCARLIVTPTQQFPFTQLVFALVGQNASIGAPSSFDPNASFNAPVPN